MHNNGRGQIRHIDRYKQLICFGEMVRHRKITPSDIDGVYDYNGSAFLYIEGKTEGKDIDYGQMTMYQNICKSHTKAGHESAVIMFEHNMPPDELINAAIQKVVKIYYNDEWHDVRKEQRTVLDIVKRFERQCTVKGINI